MLGICDHGKLWIWGDNGCIADLFPTKPEGESEDCFDRQSNYTDPVSFSWFNNKGFKTLDVKTGMHFAVVKT